MIQGALRSSCFFVDFVLNFQIRYFHSILGRFQLSGKFVPRVPAHNLQGRGSVWQHAWACLKSGAAPVSAIREQLAGERDNHGRPADELSGARREGTRLLVCGAIDCPCLLERGREGRKKGGESRPMDSYPNIKHTSKNKNRALSELCESYLVLFRRPCRYHGPCR